MKLEYESLPPSKSSFDPTPPPSSGKPRWGILIAIASVLIGLAVCEYVSERNARRETAERSWLAGSDGSTISSLVITDSGETKRIDDRASLAMFKFAFRRRTRVMPKGGLCRLEIHLTSGDVLQFYLYCWIERGTVTSYHFAISEEDSDNPLIYDLVFIEPMTEQIESISEWLRKYGNREF